MNRGKKFLYCLFMFSIGIIYVILKPVFLKTLDVISKEQGIQKFQINSQMYSRGIIPVWV